MTNYVNLTELSLEEAMIWYAVRPRSYVYKEHGWKLFKLEYPCSDTSSALHARFWNDVMPNKNDYDAVTSNSFIASSLSLIRKPDDVTPIAIADVSTNPRICNFKW